MKNYKMAWRNLWRNRRRTQITVAAIFFAVFIALLMTSFQSGSYDYLYKNAIESYSGYIQLQQEDWWDEKTIDNTFEYSGEVDQLLLSDENVEAMIPRIESFALASSGNTTKGVMVLGVDPDKEVYLSDLYQKQVTYLLTQEVLDRILEDDLFEKKNKEYAEMFLGYAYSNMDRMLLDLGINPDKSKAYIPFFDEHASYISEAITMGEPGVWMGYKLAQFLELEPGDTLVLMGQGYHGATAAGKYEIKGLMRLPLPELNRSVVYMPFDIAQDFYKCDNRITSLIVDMDENDDRSVNETSERLSELIPEGTRILDWEEMNEVLIQQMEADDAGGKAMLFVLYLVIFFGVLGTVLMMTAERKREFGVLVAIGMQKKKLASVISYEMLFMGMLGIVLASLISAPIITIGSMNPIIMKGELAFMMADYGFEAQLVMEPINTYFLWQAVIVAIMVGISLIYPVRKIRRLKVVTALRA